MYMLTQTDRNSGFFWERALWHGKAEYSMWDTLEKPLQNDPILSYPILCYAILPSHPTPADPSQIHFRLILQRTSPALLREPGWMDMAR